MDAVTKLKGRTMTKATDMIAAERERQITDEGYSTEHDRGHEYDLTRAGQAYVGEVLRNLRGTPPNPDVIPFMWPWHERFWKPTGDPVRDLVKAGALIAAAIDALDPEPHDSGSER